MAISKESILKQYDDLPAELAFIHRKFASTVNLLTVDDDESICRLLCKKMFVSPLWKTQSASKLKDAIAIIRSEKKSWHCWIVDMLLDDQNVGLTLLDLSPFFPCAVFLSASASMHMAAQAMMKRAVHVFDKNSLIHIETDDFYNTICKTASIGFILKGKDTGYFNYFKPLIQVACRNVEEWLENIHISERALEKQCVMHSIPSPKFILALFHALSYCLWNGGFSVKKNMCGPTAALSREFYLNAAQQVQRHFEKVYKPVYAHL
jgi:hypothetical protein